jgi:hypothetical protein
MSTDAINSPQYHVSWNYFQRFSIHKHKQVNKQTKNTRTRTAKIIGALLEYYLKKEVFLNIFATEVYSRKERITDFIPHCIIIGNKGF